SDLDTLVREVRAPYAETTTLRDGQAVLARQGRPERRFALARAPELAALQGSFGALLSGDAEALRRHYTVESEGDAQRWVLRLVPRDDRLAAKLRELRLHGRGDELRCIGDAAGPATPRPRPRATRSAGCCAWCRATTGAPRSCASCACMAAATSCAASRTPPSRARCSAR